MDDMMIKLIFGLIALAIPIVCFVAAVVLIVKAVS